MRPEEPHSEPRTHGGVFATTHWSVVLAASHSSTPESSAALETLCRTYWYPLYAYLRRCGFTHEDGQDLTQGFFAHVLRKEFLNGVDPEKGRFRSFLLGCLKHFIIDEQEKAHAAKRGGGIPPLPLDMAMAEERYCLDARIAAEPERLFERRWALDLLERVLDRLRRESVDSGRGAMFDKVECCLLGLHPHETYAQLGAQLGVSGTAVKVMVCRLRQRYRDLLRQEVAHTVTGEKELETEMRYLLEVVSR